MDLLTGATDEQRAAILHRDGAALVVSGPGSGKTRVITHRIAHLISTGVDPRSLVGITFTNKAADEMRERVNKLAGAHGAADVHLSTFHSFCVRLMRGSPQAFDVDARFQISDADDAKQLCLRAMANVTGKELKQVRRLDGYQSVGYLTRQISGYKNALVRPVEVEATERQDVFTKQVYAEYQMLLRRGNTLDFDDLIMRVVLSLRKNPRLCDHYARIIEYLLVDEYQDSNYAQVEMIRLLGQRRGNVFCVLDDDQCFPAGTMIRTQDGMVPIEQVDKGDKVYCAAGRGTYAWGAVDHRFKRKYQGQLVKITTKAGRELRGTEEHALFCRFKHTQPYHHVYLMYKKGTGFRIGRTSPVRGYSGVLVPGFVSRLGQERGDAIWLLRACITMEESAWWESYYAAQYGIPTACFFAGPGRKLAMSTHTLEKLFAAIDTETRAQKLLEEAGLSEDHPHHSPQGGTTKTGRARNTATLTMFGSVRKKIGTKHARVEYPWHQHELSVCSSNAAYRDEIEPIMTTAAHKDRYWHARKGLSSYQATAEYAARIDAETSGHVRRRARITDNAFQFTPMKNAIAGMTIPVRGASGEIEEDEIISVEREDYNGYVYDLSVPHYRNYCAQDVLVHNSIYKFRGADPRNVAQFHAAFPGTKTYLLQTNFRSRPGIAELANLVIANNTRVVEKKIIPRKTGGERPRSVTCRSAEDEAGFVGDEIAALVHAGKADWNQCAVIYRARFQSRALEEAMVARGIPYRIIGATGFFKRKPIKAMLAYLKLSLNPHDDLSFTQIHNYPPRGFGETSFARFCHYAEQHELRLLEVLQLGGHSDLLAGRAYDGAEAFLGIMRTLQELPQQPVAHAIKQTIRMSGYYRYVEKLKGDAKEETLQLLAELEGAAHFYDEHRKGTVLQFLEHATLMQSESKEDREERVLLMTGHAAKGLEFPHVFLVGLTEGGFPLNPRNNDGTPVSPHQSDEHYEEERRVFFVAATRAEETLTLTWPRMRTYQGQRMPCSPSRFLREGKSALDTLNADEMDRGAVGAGHRGYRW